MKISLTDSFALNGKTALVTGASSGLGWRFAEVLSQAGAKVILTARRLDKLKNLSHTIQNRGCQAQALAMDVSDKSSVFNTVKQLTNADEKIDILVNNAGIFKPTPVLDSTNHHFEDIFQTNVFGLWYVTQAVTQHMKHANIQGSIINIASVSGDKIVEKRITGYCASKAAVIHMTNSLVEELAEYKIRINTISPGWIRSEMTPAEEADIAEKIIPVGWVPEPDALDSTLLYLASNTASPYTTGANIIVDGGVSWASR